MKKRRSQRGNTLLEYSLCIVFLIVLLNGMVVTGVLLSRMVQTLGVSRDAGHMFARWVDFSVPSNQDIIVRIAAGLNMTRGGGDGTVILTQIMYVDDAQCAGAGLSVGQCPNWHKNVILKRVVIGNTSLRTSAFGTPNSALQDPDGSIPSPIYLQNASVVVPVGAQVPALAGGDFAYVSEASFTMPNLSLPYVASGGSTYAQSIW